LQFYDMWLDKRLQPPDVSEISIVETRLSEDGTDERRNASD